MTALNRALRALRAAYLIIWWVLYAKIGCIFFCYSNSLKMLIKTYICRVERGAFHGILRHQQTKRILYPSTVNERMLNKDQGIQCIHKIRHLHFLKNNWSFDETLYDFAVRLGYDNITFYFLCQPVTIIQTTFSFSPGYSSFEYIPLLWMVEVITGLRGSCLCGTQVNHYVIYRMA